MTEPHKKEYIELKKERLEIIKNDPGPWPEGKKIYSYSESKTKNPELHEWYVKKSKINYKLCNIDQAVTDLEEKVIESMEASICKEGNILVLRKPGSKYLKTVSYIVLGKHSRDRYELYNNNSQNFVNVNWKKIIKNYKLSKISEKQ